VTNTAKSLLKSPLTRNLLNLKSDMASPDQIDENLRAGVELTGSTPWILICAILIACIGLNVNSTAVIIGAMLISPLMGPIMGIGYGLGVTDFQLIKKSVINLALAASVSLMTSTAYFLISPLDLARSEILARTEPTIWDVLVALVGGVAGIIAATRKEKTNVVPGVAIATALMPPLCTAGFALSHGQWGYFAGAFYLFSINAVFIAVASFVVVRSLHLPTRALKSTANPKTLTRVIAIVAILTASPSMYLAYRMVESEVFRVRAEQGIRQAFIAFPKAHITDLKIDTKARVIELSLIGGTIFPTEIASIEKILANSGMGEVALVVHQGTDRLIDFHSLKEGILAQVYQDTLKALEDKNIRIGELEKRLNESADAKDMVHSLAKEIMAQYPQVHRVTVSKAISVKASDIDSSDKVSVINIHVSKGSKRLELVGLERWLKIRTKDPLAELHVVVGSK
jgi:uncharacterized hydrophobic protein (TIGR00271 family)